MSPLPGTIGRVCCVPCALHVNENRAACQTSERGFISKRAMSLPPITGNALCSLHFAHTMDVADMISCYS
jgi:hypothetical protein